MKFLLSSLLASGALLSGQGAVAADAAVIRDRLVTPAQVVSWTEQYATAYGVDPAWMLQIGVCESDLDPYAVGMHGEVGPYQFLPSGGIWELTPDGRAGLSPASVSIEEQVRMAAWLLSQGYASSWTCAR